MQVEKLSQCFPLVAAPLMFHGTWHISGLREQALRHFLSCLFLQFRPWDWVSQRRRCCRCSEPGESVAEIKQTEQARLFIKSEQIIVEKVRSATAGDEWAACWCTQQDVEAARWWWCQVRTGSRGAADQRRYTDEEFCQNQYTASWQQAESHHTTKLEPRLQHLGFIKKATSQKKM